MYHNFEILSERDKEILREKWSLISAANLRISTVLMRNWNLS